MEVKELRELLEEVTDEKDVYFYDVENDVFLTPHRLVIELNDINTTDGSYESVILI